ncbi:MAG: hypothetical protein JWL77_4112 [Chthonomonadaceae bacterium]|nr:hypothetical protein [Chthonomonadaceae bacterium]
MGHCGLVAAGSGPGFGRASDGDRIAGRQDRPTARTAPNTMSSIAANLLPKTREELVAVQDEPHIATPVLI